MNKNLHHKHVMAVDRKDIPGQSYDPFYKIDEAYEIFVFQRVYSILIHCTLFEYSLILLRLLQYDLPLAGSFLTHLPDVEYNHGGEARHLK